MPWPDNGKSRFKFCQEQGIPVPQPCTREGHGTGVLACRDNLPVFRGWTAKVDADVGVQSSFGAPAAPSKLSPLASTLFFGAACPLSSPAPELSRTLPRVFFIVVFSPEQRVSVMVVDATLVLGVVAWCNSGNARATAGEIHFPLISPATGRT